MRRNGNYEEFFALRPIGRNRLKADIWLKINPSVPFSFNESDIELVSDYCDIDDIIQSNVESARYDDEQYEVYKEQRYSMGSTTDIINDLFER